MATKSVLQKLASCSGIAKARVIPNARPKASLWSRLFEREETNDEDENGEEIIDEQEGEKDFAADGRPVEAPAVVQARQELSRDYWRTAMTSAPLQWNSSLPASGQVHDEPNLQVPVGGEFRFVAQ